MAEEPKVAFAKSAMEINHKVLSNSELPEACTSYRGWKTSFRVVVAEHPARDKVHAQLQELSLNLRGSRMQLGSRHNVSRSAGELELAQEHNAEVAKQLHQKGVQRHFAGISAGFWRLASRPLVAKGQSFDQHTA